MVERVDFSGNASIYDCRRGALLSPEIARELASLSALPPLATVLDIGAGTGRVAITLAALGYKTVALDPAVSMLNELRRKAPNTRVYPVVGEGARLPFGKGYFDAVILARILYLISDWQTVLRQAYEVLKAGGCLLHEWGNGEADEPWVEIREEARTLFENAGVTNPFHPGARSEGEVSAFLAELGFDRRNELQVGSGPAMTLRDFVERIVSGEFSYTWNVPKDIQELCFPKLRQWCESTLDMEQPIPIPREIRWTIFRKK